jgi:hypothetical protein
MQHGSVIEVLRGLLGTPAGAGPWLALAWCGAISVALVARFGALTRRGTSTQAAPTVRHSEKSNQCPGSD